MTKNELLKNRINEYKNKILDAHKDDFNSTKPVIVYDGIVNEKEYNKEKVKILFLLKDGNNPCLYDELDQNGCTYWDFEKVINGKAKFYSMWKIMTIITKLIKELDSPLITADNFNQNEMKKYLNYIATINVKKTAGEASCPDKKLKMAVKSYYPLIKEQIDIINPNIIICGKTFDFIKNQYDSEIKQLPNGRKYFIENGIIFLDYIHPSRKSYEKTFVDFKQTYSQLCDIFPTLKQ